MSIKTTTKGLIAIIAISLQAQILFAQWNQQSFGGNRWYRINTVGPGWTAAGVGNFASPNSPLSALHVNTNLLTPSTLFNQGEVFRTDCPPLSPPNTVTAWRMLRGGNKKIA